MAFVRLRNLIRTLIYKGDSVHCQICNWKGRFYFNQKCPKCYSVSRTRLIPYALNHFDLDKNDPYLLHIAPNKSEFGYIKDNITTLSKYDRLDIRKVKYANIVQDLRQTNLKSDHYDLVLAWHVLEHIPEDKKAIAEVYRLLKPGGNFLISVPIHPKGNLETYEDPDIAYEDFSKIHGHYDHCRSCGLDYYKRFEEIGFKTRTLYVRSLDQKELDYFGLRKDHVVWCFTK